MSEIFRERLNLPGHRTAGDSAGKVRKSFRTIWRRLASPHGEWPAPSVQPRTGCRWEGPVEALWELSIAHCRTRTSLAGDVDQQWREMELANSAQRLAALAASASDAPRLSARLRVSSDGDRVVCCRVTPSAWPWQRDRSCRRTTDCPCGTIGQRAGKKTNGSS